MWLQKIYFIYIFEVRAWNSWDSLAKTTGWVWHYYNSITVGRSNVGLVSDQSLRLNMWCDVMTCDHRRWGVVVLCIDIATVTHLTPLGVVTQKIPRQLILYQLFTLAKSLNLLQLCCSWWKWGIGFVSPQVMTLHYAGNCAVNRGWAGASAGCGVVVYGSLHRSGKMYC